MIGCLPTQALTFLAVFVYTTHATQAIAFEWKPGLNLRLRKRTLRYYTVSAASSKYFCFQIVPRVFSALDIFCGCAIIN